MTNGGALTDQSATFPYQLEAELVRSGLNIQVLNASAGGWAPSNEAGFIREHGIFGAREVVWELGTHDLFGGFAVLASADPNFPESKPLSAIGELFRRYAWPRLIGSFKGDPPLPPPQGQEAERIACLRLLGSTAAFIRARGAKLVFLVMPQPREFQDPDFAAVAKRDFLEEARRLTVPVINPYPDLLSSHKVGQEPFRDGIHPNSVGNRIMAKVVGAYLLHSDLDSGLAGTTR